MAVGRSDGVKGDGSVTQTPDGRRSFRYAIPADAYGRLIAPEQIEHQRTEMLARWVASENACPGAYAISRRYKQAGAIYYEGPASNRRRGCLRRKTRSRRAQSSQARAGLLVSVDDLLGNPARYAEAKGRARAPVESSSRELKISDPRSIIPTDLSSFCGI